MFETISLHTYEENNQLSLTIEKSVEDDLFTYLSMKLFVRSPSIQASGAFLTSVTSLQEFAEGLITLPEVVLYDENGSATITIDKIDSIGHYSVKTQVGGPEDDQAVITFSTDQTAIAALSNDLRLLISQR